MEDTDRRKINRRQFVRGYGPSRRATFAPQYFGAEKRGTQRRNRDRREELRRYKDRPGEEAGWII